MAFDLGCKGVTIYRDGSRDVQVLSTAKEEKSTDNAEEPKAEAAVVQEESKEAAVLAGVTNTISAASEKKADRVLDKEYKRRPHVLRGATYKINTPFGMAYITINDLDGIPSEIFLNVGKAGSDVFAMSEALGRVCSLFLRYGDHGNKTKLLIKHLKGIGGSGAIGFGANRVESIADAVAKALEMHLDYSANTPQYVTATEETAETAEVEEHSAATTEAATSLDLCPSCGSASLVNMEGCKNCTNCGYSRCS